MDTLIDKVRVINAALCAKYPDGNGIFQIVARLLEEAGELAAEVNHFEEAGSKRRKRGAPDKTQLAKEAQDLLRCVIHIVTHYDAADEFEECLHEAYVWATTLLNEHRDGPT